MKITYLHWADACEPVEKSVDEENLPILIEFHTSGILIREDKRSITICRDFREDSAEPYEYSECIPKAWIIKRKDMKVG